MTFPISFAYKVLKFLSLGVSLDPILQNYKTTIAGKGNNSWVFGLAGRVGVALDFGLIRVGGFFRYSLLAPKHQVASRQFSAPAPMQIGTGVSAKVLSFLSIYLDAKGILWKKAGDYKNLYKNQFVLAIGLQGRLSDQFVLRVGYNFSTKPGATKPVIASSQHYISFGVGLVFKEKNKIDWNLFYNLKNEEKTSEDSSFGLGISYARKF